MCNPIANQYLPLNNGIEPLRTYWSTLLNQNCTCSRKITRNHFREPLSRTLSTSHGMRPCESRWQRIRTSAHPGRFLVHCTGLGDAADYWQKFSLKSAADVSFYTMDDEWRLDFANAANFKPIANKRD